MRQMDIWAVLNSNFVLLLLGFILTTIAGGLISYWLQRQSWKRQTRVDLYRKRYEEGTQFLNDLSKLVGNRHFQMQRYLWAIEDKKDDSLRDVEAEYFETVAEWNATFWMNRNKIRLLVGEAQAKQFLDYADDVRTHPRSIQYQFANAHSAVVKAKNGEVDIRRAQGEVTRLNWACSRFLEDLTTNFLKRAASLQLLETPEESAEQDRVWRGD
jgi:hypothetical protein